MGRNHLNSVDKQVRSCGAEKSQRIELGLELLMLARKPEAEFTRDDIAVWCGCTDTAIFLIEERALKKVRERMRRNLHLSFQEFAVMRFEDL